MTTFYPQYGEGRDKVEPVRSVYPTQFQEVIPRYYLSATDTRDDGVGPTFEETPYSHPMTRKTNKKITLSPPKIRDSQKKKKKIRIDFSI